MRQSILAAIAGAVPHHKAVQISAHTVLSFVLQVFQLTVLVPERGLLRIPWHRPQRAPLFLVPSLVRFGRGCWARVRSWHHGGTAGLLHQPGHTLQLLFARHLNGSLGIAQVVDCGIQTDQVIALVTRGKVPSCPTSH